MDGLLGIDDINLFYHLLWIKLSVIIGLKASFLSARSLAKNNKSSASPSAAKLLSKKENIKNIQQQAKEYAKSL
ncbi:MAG: hypothetical protein GDA48_14175 [Hormoscilla sp. GM102CHS1]|nr:hypothetical protein [Hormoscilla sp. GM102CHS1]